MDLSFESAEKLAEFMTCCDKCLVTAITEKNIFYNFINDDDVDFLNSFEVLKQLAPEQKMAFYHYAMASLMARVINNTIKSMGIKIQFDYLGIKLDNVLNKKEKYDISYLKKHCILALTNNLNTLSKKKSGSEITPNEIVDLILNLAEYSGEKIKNETIVEPSCGTGAFLDNIMDRFTMFGKLSNDVLLKLLLEDKKIISYEMNPINIFISKCVILLRLIENGYHDEVLLNKIFQKIPIYQKDYLKSVLKDVDYVVGNPPYIRLHNLEKSYKDMLKNHFESATGRFDIYTCFMEKAVNSLNYNGKIAMITSNKFLTTNYGVGIRNYLQKNVNVDCLIDLNDTKVFGASVLPAIIVAGKKDKNETRYVSLKEKDNGNGYIQNIYDEIENAIHCKMEFNKNITTEIGGMCKSLEFISSNVKIPEKGMAWNFSTNNNDVIKSKIEKIADYKLQDLCDICVGIKTTADTVFVKPMTYEFVSSKEFESDLIYPLIQSFNTSKWKIDWDKSNKKDRYILYPHIEENNKTIPANLSKYPKCKEYLEENSEILKKRTYLQESKTRHWFECWVPQTLEKFRKTKIITKDIVDRNSFAIDYSGLLCQGNTFFITLKDEKKNNIQESEFMIFLLGILNSNLLEYYQHLISGNLYSSKMRYTTSNLKHWPIKVQHGQLMMSIIEITKKILDLHKTKSSICNEEDILNKLVYAYYDLSSNEIQDVEKFLNK